MTIKAGEVAFLKTTGEAVYVLAVEPVNEPGAVLVEVRRPIAGQNGIAHATDCFFIGELESLDDQQARFMSERRKVMDKFGPKTDTPGTEDLGLPFN